MATGNLGDEGTSELRVEVIDECGRVVEAIYVGDITGTGRRTLEQGASDLNRSQRND
jgi:hypothetical protein